MKKEDLLSLIAKAKTDLAEAKDKMLDDSINDMDTFNDVCDDYWKKLQILKSLIEAYAWLE
nr:MAG TPA: hypothetical protein [Caudoviricetes sp.]